MDAELPMNYDTYTPRQDKLNTTLWLFENNGESPDRSHMDGIQG